MRSLPLGVCAAILAGCSSGPLDWHDKRFAEDQELLALSGRGDELFAVGFGGAVDVSRDGGHTWSRHPVKPPSGEEPPTLWAVAPSGAERVFAVGSKGVVYRSDDDGDTWGESDVLTPRTLLAVAADAGSTIVAAGESGALFVSRDSGATWDSREAGTSHDLRAVWMRTPDDWFAVGGVSLNEEGPVGVIARSNDRGETWKTVELGTSSFDAIAESSSGIYVAGDGGALLRSVDDGATWKAVPAPTTVGLQRIAATDRRIVLVGGIPGLGTILESNDDGETFHVDVSQGPGMAGLWVTPNGAWCAMGDDTTFFAAAD